MRIALVLTLTLALCSCARKDAPKTTVAESIVDTNAIDWESLIQMLLCTATSEEAAKNLRLGMPRADAEKVLGHGGAYPHPPTPWRTCYQLKDYGMITCDWTNGCLKAWWIYVGGKDNSRLYAKSENETEQSSAGTFSNRAARLSETPQK